MGGPRLRTWGFSGHFLTQPTVPCSSSGKPLEGGGSACLQLTALPAWLAYTRLWTLALNAPWWGGWPMLSDARYS